MSQAIAISADYNYLTPAETLIKSIAYHNHNVKIYLINTDIPQEWFININNRLSPINVHIIDAKFHPDLISGESVSRNYMNKMIYGRLLIPDLVSEDKVLYLDADTIVNNKLTSLFNTDLGDNLIGAVEDYTMQGTFNSGVLLINNAKLKQIKGFSHNLLIQGQQPTSNDDQSVLNNYFKDKWTKLDPRYNIQIGLDQTVFYNETNAKQHVYNLFKTAKPRVIIHYSTADKPWNTFSSSRLRNKWWQYCNLTFNEIIHHGVLPKVKNKSKGNLFLFTMSEDNQNLAELVSALPDYDFYIASWTQMGHWLTLLSSFPNVHLFPVIVGPNIDKIIGKTDIYLDINHGPKENQFIDRCAEMDKPVLAFENTVSDNKNTQTQQIIKTNDIQSMISKIKELCH